MKHKIYALSGIFWFLMDVCWSWKFLHLALIFAVLSVMSCVIGIYSKPNMKSIERNVVLATYSWVMLNTSFLIADMYSEIPSIVQFAKVSGFIFTILSIQFLVRIGMTDGKFFENFRKL
jgi:membrane associated rhomboid family serine protease